jgi:nucleotide-binding universal stress UspA family protein
MAHQFDAEVHIIYVAYVTQYYGGLNLPSAHVVDFEAAVINGAKKKIKDFVAAHFQERDVKAKVVSGYPGEEIMNYAKSEGIDLIVMGHSRKGIKRIILGSVAGYIVKRSPIPVMIVNPDEKEE